MPERIERLRELGRALQRVTLAEQRAEDGGKQVWHAAPGVDVVSRVNWLGRAYWQEITVEGRFARWTRDDGVRTGCDDEGSGPTGRRGSTVVRFDSKPVGATVTMALAVLEEGGNDRYLGHLAAKLREALDCDATQVGDTVTEMRPAKPKAAPPPPKSFWERALSALGVGRR